MTLSEQIRRGFILFIISLGILNYLLLFKDPNQHFAIQAQSFIHGKLDIPYQTFNSKLDLVKIGDKYFWPLGPFPSILLVPFQLISPSLNQPPIQILLVVTTLYSIYRICRHLGFDQEDTAYLAICFIFASPVIAIAIYPSSNQFAQMTAVSLLFLLIMESLISKRFWVMGLLSASLIATRPTAGLIVLYIVLTLFSSKTNSRFAHFIQLAFPIVITVCLLLVFNYLRFGKAWDTGYGRSIAIPALDKLRQGGLFSLSNIPSNFSYYFLAPYTLLEQDGRWSFPYISFSRWGLSFFLTAPFFLYALRTIKLKEYRPYWIIILVTLGILLSYYHPGFAQFGPRYSLDFLPILFVLLIASFKNQKLTSLHKWLIILSALLNFYLLDVQLFVTYPVY